MFTDNSNRLPADRKLLARIFSKVRIDPDITYNGSPCWLWTAFLDGKGYGRLNLKGYESPQVHRIVYKIFVWRLPNTLVIDHLCRVRNCINPAHLEPVPQIVNTLRGGNAAKTHCVRGHPFDEENTGRNTSGGRRCRACERINIDIKDSRRRIKKIMPRRIVHSDSGAN